MRELSPLAAIQYFAVTAVFGIALGVRADDEGRLLELAIVGHRSAQQSIRTLSCTVTVESGYPDLAVRANGKYWRSDDSARIQQTTATGTVDYYLIGKESELRELVRNRPGTGQPPCSVTREPITYLPRECDVWRYMFMEFDKLFGAAKSAPQVKRERIAGRNCIRVTTDFLGTKSKLTYWFDVDRNYLIWRHRFDGADYRSEAEIVETVEPQPGIFFPTKRVGKDFRGRKQTSSSRITLSDVRINEHLDKDILRIPALPRGTICSDWINKQQYPVDENWQQIHGSKARPLEEYAIGSASPSSQGGYTRQSTAEARPWTVWIVPASLVVLFLGMAALVYRQYRACSHESR